MSEYFMLAEDGRTAIAVDDDPINWAKQRDRNRHVEYEHLGPLRISTVFLGLNHQYFDGPPLIWETMIFGSFADDEQWRYSTYDEAAAGHEVAAEFAWDLLPWHWRAWLFASELAKWITKPIRYHLW